MWVFLELFSHFVFYLSWFWIVCGHWARRARITEAEIQKHERFIHIYFYWTWAGWSEFSRTDVASPGSENRSLWNLLPLNNRAGLTWLSWSRNDKIAKTSRMKRVKTGRRTEIRAWCDVSGLLRCQWMQRWPDKHHLSGLSSFVSSNIKHLQPKRSELRRGCEPVKPEFNLRCLYLQQRTVIKNGVGSALSPTSFFQRSDWLASDDFTPVDLFSHLASQPGPLIVVQQRDCGHVVLRLLRHQRRASFSVCI